MKYLYKKSYPKIHVSFYSLGSSILTKAVQSTLGPKGRNVCLEYEIGHPRVTKDGVTVAKNILLTDNKV